MRWNFGSETNLLRSIFKSKSHPSVASAHRQMTQFKMWTDFTDHCLTKYVSFTKEINWLVIFNFWWRHRKSVFGLQIPNQLRDPFNDVTNRHHFTSSIPGANFNSIPYLEVQVRRLCNPLYAFYGRKNVHTRTIFAKRPILDVWQGSEYGSGKTLYFFGLLKIRNIKIFVLERYRYFLKMF